MAAGAQTHVQSKAMTQLVDPSFATRAHRFFLRRYVLSRAWAFQRNMHIIVNHDLQLAYLPIPKAACTSTKFAMLHLTDPRLFDALRSREIRHLHQFFARQPGHWHSEISLKKLGYFAFCIVRDPIERFISAYVNRVIEMDETQSDEQSRQNLVAQSLPAQPDINFFAENIHAYAAANKWIHHHVRPQSEFIKSRGLFDCIYRMDQIPELMDDLSKRLGARFEIPSANRSKTNKPELTQNSLIALRQYYQADYEMFPDLFTLAPMIADPTIEPRHNPARKAAG